MYFRLILVGLFLGSITSTMAQRLVDRKLFQMMEAGKFHSVRQTLDKAIRKDSTRAENWYALSVWYSSIRNPDYQIDSADLSCRQASQWFQRTPSRDLERLLKIPMDSLVLGNLRKRIDSLAFERAKAGNTEESYGLFIKRFAEAGQVQEAQELQQEVSFLEALKSNTPESFTSFLVRYPKASRSKEARERYERLLYDRATEAGDLRSFLNFVKTYPRSPYRRDADLHIYQALTVDGHPESCQSFLEKYPENTWAGQAREILFYLQDLPLEVSPEASDSLLIRRTRERSTLIPFRKNGLYGFMNTRGAEIIKPRFPSIEEHYLCGNITDIFLKTSEGLVDRWGKIVSDSLTQSREVGLGFVTIGNGSREYLIHQSVVRLIPEAVEDVRILQRQFLAVKVNSRWKLMAFNGKVLSEGWEDIQSASACLVFSRLGKKSVATGAQVMAAVDGRLPAALVFDEVRTLSANRLLVTNGSLEGIINDSLVFVVPLERQTIQASPYGIKIMRDRGFRLIDVSPGLSTHEWKEMKTDQRWLQLQREGTIVLVDIISKEMITPAADSVVLRKGVAVVYHSDSTTLYFSSRQHISVGSGEKISFILSDPVQYFYVTGKKNATVYDVSKGKRIFTQVFETIEYLPQKLFLVTHQKRKGLVRLDGRVVVPLMYDAIVWNPGGFFSLLLKGRMGAYHPEKNQVLEAVYDRNLMLLPSGHWVASQGGKYGLIDPQRKGPDSFTYEEVLPWNRDQCWVKQQGQWLLIVVTTRIAVLSGVKRFEPIGGTSQEKFLLYHRENYFGVISSTQGIIIPSAFSDVINVGSEDDPVFFTEKFIEEADIYIVIYYDRQGKFLRKQVYEKEEYHLIYCDE